MLRAWPALLFFLLATGVACSPAASDDSAASGAALEDGFAKKVTKLTTLPDASTSGKPAQSASAFGLPTWQPFATHAQTRYEPLFAGCTNGDCLWLIDGDKVLVHDAAALHVAVEDRGTKVPRLDVSPDRKWLAFQKKTDQTSSIFVVPAGDALDAAWAWQAADGAAFEWLGKDVLVIKSATTVHVFDVSKRTQRFSVDVAGGNPGDLPAVVATPSADSILVFTATEAKLVQSSDGSATAVTDWNVLPEITGRAGAAARTTQQKATVVASPSGDGFAIVRESVDNVHRSIAFLDLDGTLSVLSPAARPEIAFASDGALAWVRPVEGATLAPNGSEDSSIVVHRAGGDDVVLDGATAFTKGVRFTPDGKKIMVAEGRFVGSTDKSGPLELLDLGDKTSGVGQVSYTANLDQAFIQLFKKGTGDDPSPLPGRLVRLDLATKKPTALMPVKELPKGAGADFFWMTAEPDADEPVLFLRMNWNRRLVAPNGKTLCMLPYEMQEVGWSQGVFYYVKELRTQGAPSHYQLHGVSRDCKVDAIIHKPADELLLQTTPDRSDGYNENALTRAFFRIGRDVFAFEPSRFVSTEKPGESSEPTGGNDNASTTPPPSAPRSSDSAGADDPAPPSPTPTEPTVEDVSSPKQKSSDGCSTSPGSSSPGAALAFAGLALALGAHRRRETVQRRPKS